MSMNTYPRRDVRNAWILMQIALVRRFAGGVDCFARFGRRTKYLSCELVLARPFQRPCGFGASKLPTMPLGRVAAEENVRPALDGKMIPCRSRNPSKAEKSAQL